MDNMTKRLKYNHESFKDLPGYEGVYLIGSKGTLISLHNNNAKKIKAVIDRNIGYKKYSLCKDRKKESAFEHVLVAMAFLGDRKEGIDIHHKDKNKLNNDFNNLEYIPHSEHMKISNVGEDCTFAKLRIEHVMDIRKKQFSCKYYADKYGVGKPTITDIWKNRTWKHVK